MSNIKDLISVLCPAGVPFKRLGDIGSFYGGLSGKSKDDFKDGNSIFITYMNVYSNIEVKTDVEDSVYIGENENQNTVQYGDVLFTGSSETPDECGMSSVLATHTEKKLYLNSFCFGYRFDEPDLFLPGFTKHLFRSEDLRNQIIKTASGVTRFNVSKKKMEDVKIPIPPLEVQREIARVLDNFTFLTVELTADLTAELTARRKQYEHYRNGLFAIQSDGNIESIQCNYVTLEDISVNCDSQRKPVTKGKRKKGKYPYYGASGVVDYVDDYIFDGDYLLISEDGANLLARVTPIAFSIEGKNWVNNHAHVLRFEDRYVQRYVEMYFNNIDLTKYISGAAQPKLNQKNLNTIKIPFPKEKEKVKRIVDILNHFDKLCNDISIGLPTEIAARQKQYEYYRDKLLAFMEI